MAAVLGARPLHPGRRGDLAAEVQAPNFKYFNYSHYDYIF
jgi:hypothetical protein